MAVSFVAVSSSGVLVNGTTTTAGTANCTPGLPTGTASGDRVFLFQAGSNTTIAPAGWTILYQDVQVGAVGTAPGSGLGRRYISCYYRDYDGSWSMPSSVQLTSATNNSQAAYALTLRKAAGDTWDTPTASGPGHDTTTGTDQSITTPSFATASGGFLISHTAHVAGASTASAESITQTGATFSATTERVDNGTTTGNDVRMILCSASVTTGATAPVSFTATLSGSSISGGTSIVQQTVNGGGGGGGAASSFPPLSPYRQLAAIIGR